MQLWPSWYPLMIVVFMLMIVNIILWVGICYRYWAIWRHFRQPEMPFVVISLVASGSTMSYLILYQPFFFGYTTSFPIFLIGVGLAAAFYFAIGAFLARYREIAYSRFIDNLLRTKYKEKQISRTDFILGRYPDDVLLTAQKHPRTAWYSKQTLIGYFLTGLSGVLLIPLLADPNMWLPPIPHYLVPLFPNLLAYLIISLTISLFITGLLILAEKWPYPGLATIILTIIAVTAIIHIPHLLHFQILILISGILGGIIPFTKHPVTPTKPIETPSELLDLVPPQPPLTPAHKTAYIGGGIVLTGAILTIIANILAVFLLFLTYPMLAMILGIPLHQLILANFLWITIVTTLSILALIAAGLIFRQDWKTGGILALISGIFTIWMIWGLITLIGAIIVLTKYPKTELEFTE